MVDGSLGEALREAEVLGARARNGRAVSPTLAAEVDEIDAARGREYALLSALLARPPDQSLLELLADLSVDSIPLGVFMRRLCKPRAERMPSESSGNISTCSSVLGEGSFCPTDRIIFQGRSEEHTSEFQ